MKTEKIKRLVGKLSGNHAVLLFIGLSKSGAINITPSFYKNVDRLRNEKVVTLSSLDMSNQAKIKFLGFEMMCELKEEPVWAPLLEFYNSGSKCLAEIIESHLASLGADDDEGGSGGGDNGQNDNPKPQPQPEKEKDEDEGQRLS